MRSMHPRYLLLFVVAFVFSACSGSGSESAEFTTSGGSPGALEIDASSSSPIADYFGVDLTDINSMRANQIEIETEAGLIAQKCMLEQGFEFTPPRSAGQRVVGPTGQDLDPGSEEWIARYGFGITTLHFPQAMVGDLVGIPLDEMPITNSQVEELNREYTDTLSDAEREAYDVALNPDDGCTFEAFEYIRSAGPDLEATFDAFRDELDEMQNRIDADPRVIEFYAEVNACVTEAGLEFDGFHQTAIDLGAKLAELRDLVEETDDGQQRLGEAGRTRLAELQAGEVELAQAVVACDGGPDATEAAIQSVIAEYELAFLTENADELANFRSGG